MSLDAKARAALEDAAKAAADSVAAIEDPTERYSAAVELAGYHQQLAQAVVLAASPSTADPVPADEDAGT